MTTWWGNGKDEKENTPSPKVTISRKRLFIIAGGWCLIGFLFGFLVFAE